MVGRRARAVFVTPWTVLITTSAVALARMGRNPGARFVVSLPAGES